MNTRRFLSRVAATAAVVSLLSMGSVAVSAQASPVSASVGASIGLSADVISLYPTWDDVARARISEAAASQQVTAIQGMIQTLASEAATKHAESVASGDALYQAQAKVDVANVEVAAKQVLVDKAQARADKSAQMAGRVAEMSTRLGGSDLSAKLFFSGKDSGTLIHELASDSELTDLVKGLYDKATKDRDAAKSLRAQAKHVRDQAQSLADAATTAMQAAQTASDAAQAAADESTAHSAQLAAQLDALRTHRQITETEYAQSIAVPVTADTSTQDTTAQFPSGSSSAAWVRPASGAIVSGFGPRTAPCSGCSTFHEGLDFGASCNTPIVAASAGTVEYAGLFGGYGNFVRINHGNGLTTGYGHIVNGGIQVKVGQVVAAGQQIALVGSTGHSTGCHLHFETRVKGVAQDPAAFLRAHGVTV